MLCIEGVTILSFYPDWMHCKSLGIDKPLLGSVLYILIHYVLLGSVEENLMVVWQDIQKEYEKLGSANRYGHMRQTMFTTKSVTFLFFVKKTNIVFSVFSAFGVFLKYLPQGHSQN